MISEKILVVDDEAEIRDLLSQILTRAGFGVDTAESGAAGISKAKKTAYSVAIVDLRIVIMPT